MCAPYTELEKPLNTYSLLCRGCLVESGEMKNMYDWGLVEDFEKVTDLQVKRLDGISELLCVSCEDALLKSKRFKLQCQQSDWMLKNTVKKNSQIKSMITGNMAVGCEEPKENSLTFVLRDNKLVIMIVAVDVDTKIHLTCPYAEQYHCKGSYLKRKHLLAHLMKAHDVDEKLFKIELEYYCKFESCTYNISSGKYKYFTERKFLNQHYNKVHRSKSFKCDTCDFSYSTKTEYDRHLKTCNVVYLCQLCDIQYKTNDRLLVHLMRKHPELHKQYKNERKNKRRCETVTESKRIKTDMDRLSEYICDSPKRSFATQTLKPEENIKNDVTLPSWTTLGRNDGYEAKTDEISTQTVFEDLLSLKSQTSEDDCLFSETVSLSDIQTQTFPMECGFNRSNKETITSETQSPDLSIKETQTCYCHYDSPKPFYRLFDGVSPSPTGNLTSTETQTADMRTNVKSDVLLSFSSAETQTCFDDGNENSL